jgi:hypothetical protein
MAGRGGRPSVSCLLLLRRNVQQRIGSRRSCSACSGLLLPGHSTPSVRPVGVHRARSCRMPVHRCITAHAGRVCSCHRRTPLLPCMQAFKIEPFKHPIALDPHYAGEAARSVCVRVCVCVVRAHGVCQAVGAGHKRCGVPASSALPMPPCACACALCPAPRLQTRPGACWSLRFVRSTTRTLAGSALRSCTGALVCGWSCAVRQRRDEVLLPGQCMCVVGERGWQWVCSSRGSNMR